MAKVICKLPNASELINGVRFVTHKLGMISEEIEDEAAAAFTAIEGYILHEKKGASSATQDPAPTPAPEPVPQPAPPAPAASDAAKKEG